MARRKGALAPDRDFENSEDFKGLKDLKDFENVMQAVDLLKALSNPHRLAILCRLEGAEHSVSELGKLTGLSQSALSQHLAKLRELDLVETRKERQTVYYALKSPEVKAVIGTLHSLYCDK